MFNFSNSKLCYIGYVFQHFSLYKKQDKTVEWNQMAYNEVLKYTEQVFIRDLSISDCRLSRNDTTWC